MKIKKILAAGCATACAAAMMVTPVFAMNSANSGSGETAAHIVVNSTSDGGSSALVTLDVSVTAKLTFNGSKTGVLTQQGKYQMVNNQDAGSVICTNVSAAAVEPWTLENDTKAIQALPLDTNTVGFSIGEDSLHDGLKEDLTVTAAPDKQPVTIAKVTGRCAPRKTPVDGDQVATFTATIGLVEAKQVP